MRAYPFSWPIFSSLVLVSAIYPQMNHLLLGQFFDLKRYCPNLLRERLGRSNGEDPGDFLFFVEQNIQWNYDCHHHPPMLYDSLLSSQIVAAVIWTSFGAYCSPS